MLGMIGTLAADTSQVFCVQEQPWFGS